MSQQQHTSEPFGFFKAEPFGWTDCAETDDGAQPLYDQAAIDELGERLMVADYARKDALRQRDALLEVFQLVITEIEHRGARSDGNAPGHGHSIPGVWDSDNGKLAGKPCAWCAVWKKAKEFCNAFASAKGSTS